MMSENDANGLSWRKLIHRVMRLWRSRYGATWWSTCKQRFAALHFVELMSLRNCIAYILFLPFLHVTFPPSPAVYILAFDYYFRIFWTGRFDPYCYRSLRSTVCWNVSDSGFRHWEGFSIESHQSYLGDRRFLLYTTFSTPGNTEGEVASYSKLNAMTQNSEVPFFVVFFFFPFSVSNIKGLKEKKVPSIQFLRIMDWNKKLLIYKEGASSGSILFDSLKKWIIFPILLDQRINFKATVFQFLG